MTRIGLGHGLGSPSLRRLIRGLGPGHGHGHGSGSGLGLQSLRRLEEDEVGPEPRLRPEPRPLLRRLKEDEL